MVHFGHFRADNFKYAHTHIHISDAYWLAYLRTLRRLNSATRKYLGCFTSFIHLQFVYDLTISYRADSIVLVTMYKCTVGAIFLGFHQIVCIHSFQDCGICRCGCLVVIHAVPKLIFMCVQKHQHLTFYRIQFYRARSLPLSLSLSVKTQTKPLCKCFCSRKSEIRWLLISILLTLFILTSLSCVEIGFSVYGGRFRC